MKRDTDQTHIVYRDCDRPLKFKGELLAEVESSHLRAKVYRTRAGTFVTSVEDLEPESKEPFLLHVDLHGTEEELIDHLTFAAMGASSLPPLLRDLGAHLDVTETIE